MTREQLERYRDTLRRRSGEERRVLAKRKDQAYEAAIRCAAILKETFSASRVILFGSAAGKQDLHVRSDVDLAAWGLSPEAHLEAVAALQACTPGFSVDLIRMPHCPPALKEAILEEGVEL